jgi:hypothetical protein
MAFEARSAHLRIVAIPPALGRFNAAMLRPFHPRLSQLVQFVVGVSTNDIIGPCVGRRRLDDYFRERLQR